MKRFTLFLGVVCGALFLTCGSAPKPTDVSPDLFPELAESLGRFPDMRAESLARHYNESITAVDYEKYAVIKRVLDYYSGGAHGMTETFFSVFDRSAARFVTLADIADEARLTALREAVAGALRERFELRADEPLTAAGFFEGEFALTENFFLSEEGIGFHWNPYELAPYSFGAIEVVVPLK
ncbi:MAG: RsiV family protein [Spirochaetaceae bacterium]|nr:RsiV family protein [Spirochaetaceae bacterium]